MQAHDRIFDVDGIGIAADCTETCGEIAALDITSGRILAHVGRLAANIVGHASQAAEAWVFVDRGQQRQCVGDPHRADMGGDDITFQPGNGKDTT